MITLPTVNREQLATLGEGRIHKKMKGGFFELDKKVCCHHPEHNPPQYICIPQGKGYKHVCPNCGKEQIIIPSQYTL